MNQGIKLSIRDESQVGECRRLVASRCGILGFTPTDSGRATIVATELTQNILRHGLGGEILIRELSDSDGGFGIEMLGLDKGPGMTNISACSADGYSSKGTQGTGLGSIERQSDVFDIHSQPDLGTAVLSRIMPQGFERDRRPFETGVVCLAIAGEVLSGDSWEMRSLPTGLMTFVVDGLGHGPVAHEAAVEGVRAFTAKASLDTEVVLQAVHGALQKTRGAAGAIAVLDSESRELRWCGIGNIAGAVVTSDTYKGTVSHNGILGLHMPRFQQLTYPWPPGALLVMHSDGLATRWRLEDYGGILRRHPALIAGVLYRDFSRGRDDVTIVVIRERRSE